MNRIEFMDSLGEILRELSAEERAAAIQFYNDYFEDAGLENEAHVIAELGSPQKVASTIKAGLVEQRESHSEYVEYGETGYTDTRFEEKEELINRTTPNKTEENIGKKEPKEQNVVQILLLVLGIIFIGIPVILPLTVAALTTILAILIAISAIFVGLIVAAVVVMVSGIVVFIIGLSQIISALPSALLLSGVGMLLFVFGMVGTVLLVKVTVVTVVAIFKGIVKICRMPFEKRGVVAG